MIIKGKHNTIEVFTDNVDEASVNQIQRIADCEVFKDETIKVMPDCHSGVGCVIGYTQTYNDKIVPNLVGVDISCGMSYMKVPELDLHTLDKIIHAHVPSGMNIHNLGDVSSKTRRTVEDMLSKLKCDLPDKAMMRALASVGTLGGGNHFLEVDRSIETGQNYLIVHSGSRNPGLRICNYWQRRAIQNLKVNKSEVDNVIRELKSQGRDSEIENVIRGLKNKNKDIPDELAYLEGADMADYLNDAMIADRFADLNRRTILETIAGKLGIKTHKTEIRTTKHNYIDQAHKMLRKGSISAYEDEEVLIPFNMRDGSIIAVGKGNKDWNNSAPHGAGRLLSRNKAKEVLLLDDFVNSMKGIYTSSVSESTIDESPMAYKPSEEIESLISATVEVKEHLKPIYNFKAGN